MREADELRELLAKATERMPPVGAEHADLIHIENDWNVRLHRARRDIVERLPAILDRLDALEKALVEIRDHNKRIHRKQASGRMSDVTHLVLQEIARTTLGADNAEG